MALNVTTFMTRTPITAAFLNAFKRGNQEQVALQRFPVLLQDFRYTDGLPPAVAAAAGKPGIKMGGPGVGTGYFQGELVKAATKTERLAIDLRVPECYDDGQDLQVGITCRLNLSGGTVSVKTIDMECYKAVDAGTAGSDLCATAVQTMTTSMAEYIFVITPTGLVRGDRLRVILTTVVTETANAGTQYAEVGGACFLCDIRG